MGHLKDVDKTYFEHFQFAIGAGIILIVSGICACIHAFIPGVFKGVATESVTYLNDVFKIED